MTRLSIVLTVGMVVIMVSGSVADAALPPTAVWSDNFAGANGTSIASLPGWAAIPGFNTLTSYAIENTFSPPVSARTFGMNVNAVFTLQQTVTGMGGYTSQWFHFKAHKANGVSSTLLDEVRVATSGGAILGFKIAETQVMAFSVNPTASSPLLGDQLSLTAWREFDVRYDNAAGAQTVTFYINNGAVWTTGVSDPGPITAVQFVQQGGAKPATGENHLIGEMRVGTADCPPPPPPTGINASASPVCSGASSMLSVNSPGAGLTTDWLSGSCGGTPVPGGTGVNSVSVSPTATTTYYARTRNTATGCVSTTCQSVAVTVPDCDDGNVCTTDTCSSGVCGHTNNSNACEDGDPCTENDTCQGGICVPGTPVDPCVTTNGFEPDRIYVIRGGSWDSEVRMLDENAADIRHSDLGPFGTQADRTWPIAVATLYDPQDGNGGQDASIIKSICFTNSPVAGQHSPAGARLFGVYDVRALDEPETSIDETSYYSVGFQIVELDSTGRRIRVMKVGLAANLNEGNTSTDALTDLCWTGCAEGADPVDYRNNTNGCRIGNIRYNRAKNTLCVAANIAEHDNGDVCRPPVGRVYEFELPDWPIVYYSSQDAPNPGMVGEPIPQSDPNVVKLVQVYEMPSRCETAQGTRYDVDRCECLTTLGGTWYGHNISQENGRTGRNEGQRPTIAIDGDGNLYFTSRFFNATSAPIHNGSYWSGGGLYWGDVVKCSTLGHYAGKQKFVVPITGADAANLVIQTQIEEAIGGYPLFAGYDGGQGLAVRGSQLIQVPQLVCNDLNAGPYRYVNVFDLNSRVGGSHPNELARIKSLYKSIPLSGANWTNAAMTVTKTGAFTAYTYGPNTNVLLLTGGTGVVTGQYTITGKLSNDAITIQTDINGGAGDINDSSIVGEINLSRADIPRKPNYAQLDEESGKTFMTNEMGDCAAAQNFMLVENDQPTDTVVHDVGYFLDVVNPDGSSAGNLNHTWDAASPSATAINQVGACCKPGNVCEELTQTACAAAGGLWRGKGSTCAQSPCPSGACCKPCGVCLQTLDENQCAAASGQWAGFGTVCGQAGVCGAVCAQPPADGDCDGDVDADDFGVFQLCYNPGGPIPALPAHCGCFDLDHNGTINHLDFGLFQNCASGPSVPAASTCP